MAESPASIARLSKPSTKLSRFFPRRIPIYRLRVCHSVHLRDWFETFIGPRLETPTKVTSFSEKIFVPRDNGEFERVVIEFECRPIQRPNRMVTKPPKINAPPISCAGVAASPRIAQAAKMAISGIKF